MSNQLMLFDEPKNELSVLWDSMKNLETSQHKVRKRLFHEISSLKNEIVEIKLENEKMKFRSGIKPTIRWTA
jgi:hypothetical protein